MHGVKTMPACVAVLLKRPPVVKYNNLQWARARVFNPNRAKTTVQQPRVPASACSFLPVLSGDNRRSPL
jgi:hypothetical protein